MTRTTPRTGTSPACGPVPCSAFSPKPGAASETVVGDLSTSAGGKASNGNKTWQYTVVDGAKFSNGDPITAMDVAYAITRSNWSSSLTGGPHYFEQYVLNTNKKAGTLETGGAAQAQSLLPSGITVTGQTITFNLNTPVSDFDYLMTLPQTAPYDLAAFGGVDPGPSYPTKGVISSAGYSIQSFSAEKQMVLTPNSDYVASTDPNKLHAVHASKITLNFKVAQDTIDQDILHGRAQADLGGVGVDSADQGVVLGNPTNKALADDPVTGFENYLTLNTQVAPLDNVDCRQAVEYAVDKAQVQSVMGGSIGAGQIATTIIPPTLQGYAQKDTYQTPGEAGDTAKAKQLVASCKAAEGSKWNAEVNVSAFSDQPKDVDGSNAIAQQLSAVGFTSTVKSFQFSTWGSTIGNLNWEKTNRVLVANVAWGPDFPDGNGFMTYMVGAAGVSTNGNASNYTYWTDKTFNGMLASALQISDPTARNAEYAKADQYAMAQAVIVPLLDETALDIRAKNATNVYVMNAYGMYDYAAIGASQ